MVNEDIMVYKNKVNAGTLNKNKIKGVDFSENYCPSGEFEMGSDVGYNEERPRHKVKITKGFWIGTTQVTQELWTAIMGYNPSYLKGNTQKPVGHVSWLDAIEFCNRLSKLDGRKEAYTVRIENAVINSDFHDRCAGKNAEISTDFTANGYRLPTEAEFEYAAKSGTEFIFAGSDNLDEVGWYKSNTRLRASSVKQKKPNAWGIYDLSGNVQEWCSDSWDENAYKDRKQAVKDPVVHSSKASVDRVVRGGSFNYSPDVCRVSFRDWGEIDDRWSDIGFRFVRNG